VVVVVVEVVVVGEGGGRVKQYQQFCMPKAAMLSLIYPSSLLLLLLLQPYLTLMAIRVQVWMMVGNRLQALQCVEEVRRAYCRYKEELGERDFAPYEDMVEKWRYSLLYFLNVPVSGGGGGSISSRRRKRRNGTRGD